MIAAVYGRFHYVLDTLAGAALAIVVVLGYRYIFGDGRLSSPEAPATKPCRTPGGQ